MRTIATALGSWNGLLVALALATGGGGACAPAAAKEPATVGGNARLALASGATGASTADLPHPTPRRATLRYEIHGKPFPLPLVMGTVGGQPVLMLVDTGANSHVIAGWLARKLGLTMKKLGDVGTDHVGKSIATFRVEKPELAIDDWGALAPTAVLATEVPDVIEKLGIGVFISPQRLVEEGDAVVLDLQKGELRPALWEEAHYDLSASGIPLVQPEQGRACEENEGPIKGLAFVVPATVESQKVNLLVDTGAQHSDVFNTSPAGLRLTAQSTINKEPMYTASGRISARKIKGARVVAGAYTALSDVDLIAGAGDASCPRDGVLAMDILRSCALLLGRTKMFARCLPADVPR